MSIWLLLVSLLPHCHSHGGAQYECGPHGRFEYCIDGIPGCVIGCHCHPGYYFDTDTKVCEPNMKLTQDYRRNYLPEPTRVPNLEFDQRTSTIFTPTNTNPVDAKIDEITNDADDLGDWLYSQFFKTIENQVLNSTVDNQPNFLTRRSGSATKKKPKRRSRKRWKKNGKRTKRKKGLKKKLLRITEDDSLFDSSSGSTSDEDTSSSSSDDDTDSSSDSEKTDQDHGHKKIIIFNKKPKPPLPSFIFLPNMDTPFYPPIGLPPPPVIPMYPFVPVPPVAPMIPYPGLTTQCDDGETSAALSSTSPPTSASSTTTTSQITTASTSETTTAVTTSASSVATSAPASDTTAAPSDQTTAKALRGRDPPHFGKMMKNKSKHAQRNKLLQKLKEKIKRRNKFPQLNSLQDDYMDMEEPLMDSFPKPAYSRQIQSNAIEEDIPTEDVDFKYLTELIHRIDFNNTRRPPQFPIKPKISPGGRRNYDPVPVYSPPSAQAYRVQEPRRPRVTKPDDTYYSNLGRQIATMIRKIDMGGNREIDIEIQGENAQTPEHPVFSENSHPRSYWERSVRSPSNMYFEPRDSTFTYLKHSNENLFNLENKVEVVVSTNKPLSLQEIENIINKMEHTRVIAKNINNSVVQIPTRKLLNPTKFFPNPKQFLSEDKINNTGPDTIKYENASPSGNRYRFLVNNYPTPSHSTLAPAIKTNKHKIVFHNKGPTRKPKAAPNENASKVQGYVNYFNYPSTTTKRSTVFRPNPIIYNRKNLKYHSNNNQYLYEKTSFPFYYSSLLSKINQPIEKSAKPSYFHHEMHHFDYFDD